MQRLLVQEVFLVQGGEFFRPGGCCADCNSNIIISIIITVVIDIDIGIVTSDYIVVFMQLCFLQLQLQFLLLLLMMMLLIPLLMLCLLLRRSHLLLDKDAALQDRDPRLLFLLVVPDPVPLRRVHGALREGLFPDAEVVRGWVAVEEVEEFFYHVCSSNSSSRTVSLFLPR